MSSVLRLTSEQTLDYSSSQAINFLDLEARFADWAFLHSARTRDRDPDWFDAFMTYEVS
jgi:hypothetical protein